MKKANKDIERYFNCSAMNICDGITKRVEEFTKDYNKKQFGKEFFLGIELSNVLTDLQWYRDNRLKTHLILCKSNGVDKSSFAVTHAEHYSERLRDIELKSFIHVLRLKESWFGYSKETQDKWNKELCEIAKEVLSEIKTD